MRRPIAHANNSTARRGAFSLAELMIALAVLGIGLLAIAAALPAGVKYTKESVDQATAGVAAEYALDTIAARVCRRASVLDTDSSSPDYEQVRHAARIFQPRIAGFESMDPLNAMGDQSGRVDAGWEPLIKVRPLFTQNINRTPGGASANWGHWNAGEDFPTDTPGSASRIVVWPERATYDWLQDMYGGRMSGFPWMYSRETGQYDSYGNPVMRPVLSASQIAYPPIQPAWTGTNARYPAAAITDITSRAYSRRTATDAELAEAAKSPSVWTALYRRVSYQNNTSAARAMYEFIVINCRVPSANHRFPVQDPTNVMQAGATLSDLYADIDTLAPVPWLVTFDDSQNDWVTPLPQYNNEYYLTSANDIESRVLDPNNFTAPATLTFRASEAVGQLMPPGSVFIPAVNDVNPNSYWHPTAPPAPVQNAGFLPYAPDTLPVYRVTGREFDEDTETYQIIVANNGFYPWLNDAQFSTRDPRYWPVWVIPPAFEETVADRGGYMPVFSNQSPVVNVSRRYISLREF